MDENMFDDLDPYERIMVMQARIEQLEQTQDEIIKNLNIKAAHMNAMSDAINQVQKEQLEIIRKQYATNGESQ